MFVRRRRRPRATLAKASAPAHRPPSPAQPPAPRFISWTALGLLTVASVGNLGSASPLAVVGLSSVFFYVLPALVFLVPISLVAAELASGWPGGVYNWVSQGISAPMGLLAIWCEFAQTIFFYPSLLAYVAGTLAYVFDPGLASNGVYNAVVIIVLFWGIVLLVNSFFTYAGVEVNAVHVDELRNPAREFPKAIFLAMALVLAVFIGP